LFPYAVTPDNTTADAHGAVIGGCGIHSAPRTTFATKTSPSPIASNCADLRYNFTFSEIFAGIGGFRLGLDPIGGKCVFVSELDCAAQITYALNFDEDNATVAAGDDCDGGGVGDSVSCLGNSGLATDKLAVRTTRELRVGDITSIYAHDIPYCDILTGGE
jgi:hypothetical protein